MTNIYSFRQSEKIILTLAGIVLMGLILRCAALNFPSVGYHNMKENEILSIADTMRDSQDFVTQRVYFYHPFDDDPRLEPSAHPPLVAYETLAAWQIFGRNLWSARALNVVFGLLCIILVYGISRMLFAEVWLALVNALIISIMPVTVFFSRNLQSESPAFFFMVLGTFCYLWAIRKDKLMFFLWGGVSFCVAWLYEARFILGVVPFLLCLPYDTLWRKRQRFNAFIITLLLPFLLLAGYYGWFSFVHHQNIVSSFKPWVFFSPVYWKGSGQTIIWFARSENFTTVYAFCACAAGILVWFELRTLVARYILGCMVMAVMLGVCFNDALTQNNFSQMPLALGVCIAAAYTIRFLGHELGRRLFKRQMLYAVSIVVVALSIPDVAGALSRMQQTVFLGADAAGETIQDLTGPEARVFLYTYAQGYAIARYAKRFMGWPKDLAELKKLEKKFGVRYIVVYPGDLIAEFLSNKELHEYVQDNYHVLELGLFEYPNRLAYCIFEKGKGKMDISQLVREASGRLESKAVYRVGGRLQFVYGLTPVDKQESATAKQK